MPREASDVGRRTGAFIIRISCKRTAPRKAPAPVPFLVGGRGACAYRAWKPGLVRGPKSRGRLLPPSCKPSMGAIQIGMTSLYRAHYGCPEHNQLHQCQVSRMEG